ncbi:MAG: rhomboid family intramembrane serine protease [Alistipes sp.]|nr:rhomboid family intramembrane serine protease [Alistipes sp.]
MSNNMQSTPVVKNLLIANCVIFLATYLIPSFNSLMGEYFQLYWFGAPRYHSYQFITYMFLHGSISHLFFNMYALWMFGRVVEYDLGSRRFLIYYIVCGVGAALVQLGVATLAGEYYIRLVGASGAVMGLLLAFGVMHPNERLFVIPFPVPIKAKWFVVGYALIELFLGSSGLNSQVAHFAHVGGMLWGLALLYYWRRRNKIFF